MPQSLIYDFAAECVELERWVDLIYWLGGKLFLEGINFRRLLGIIKRRGMRYCLPKAIEKAFLSVKSFAL